jgi:hypothetical protein
METKKLDLKDAFIRKTLRSGDFVCKFGDKKYLVCADEACIFHRAEPCRRTFLGRCIARDELIEKVTEEDIWKMGGIRCFSKDHYDYRRM